MSKLIEGLSQTELENELYNRYQNELEYQEWLQTEEFVEYVNGEIDSTKPRYSESDIIGATLGSLLDKVSNLTPKDIQNQESSGWKRLVIIAATNRIDAIPSYLRRPGRFDREICVSSPTAQARYKILKSILSEIGAFIANEEEKQQDLMHIADLTVGYVAADLSSLVRRALLLSISAGQSGQSHVISTKHLQQAMQDVGASALRDTSASAPPATTWDDIAGDAGGAKVSI